MKLRLPKLNAGYAYIGSSLFIPRSLIQEGPVRSALTFGQDESGDARVLVTPHLHHIEVPREFLQPAQLRDLGIPVVDLRRHLQPFARTSLRHKWTFSFREKQRPAWDALRKTRNGVLCLSCGSGKTVMALSKAADLQVPTLIVSPQDAHFEMWEREIHDWFDFDGKVGHYKGADSDYRYEVCMVTVQTLAKRAQEGGLPDDFATYFGLGIWDEVHHLAAKFFVKSADILYGDRLGLTATEKRNDRCEGIVYSHLGPVMYKDTAQEMDPVVYVVQTSATLDALEIPEVTDVGGNVHLGKMRAWLGTKSDRNDCIRKVIDDCRSRSRKVYALTHSPEHAALMSAQYPGSGCITGAVKHADRLDQLASSDLVFASMQVGAEAYNRKDLDVVIFMTSPAANSYTSPVFLQGVGRALRFVPGKPQPEVYLLLDPNIEESAGLTYSLIAEAKRQGWETKPWNTTLSSPRRKSAGW